MARRSAAPNLQTQLVALLQARPGLAGVQVSDGAPVPLPEIEFVMVGDQEGTQDAATYGGSTRLPREEHFLQKILIRTINSDVADGLTPRQRAFDLMAEIEQALQADPSVSGAVRTAELARWKKSELIGAEQRGCDLELEVLCKTRLTT